MKQPTPEQLEAVRNYIRKKMKSPPDGGTNYMIGVEQLFREEYVPTDYAKYCLKSHKLFKNDTSAVEVCFSVLRENCELESAGRGDDVLGTGYYDGTILVLGRNWRR